MASLSSQSSLYDPIRKEWVRATPEEHVRQSLLEKMVRDLHYPSSMIAVEKQLSTLPHLALEDPQAIPKRRADILVFAQGIHKDYPLFPLLMIECKAVKLTPKCVQQVVGYNTMVKAPFLAVANQDELVVGMFDREDHIFRFESGFKSFHTLLSMLAVSPMISSAHE